VDGGPLANVTHSPKDATVLHCIPPRRQWAPLLGLDALAGALLNETMRAGHTPTLWREYGQQETGWQHGRELRFQRNSKTCPKNEILNFLKTGLAALRSTR